MAGIELLLKIMSKGLRLVLIGCFALAAPLGSVHAGMVTTEAAIRSTAPDATGQALRAELRAELAAQGVGTDEALARVAALSDVEVAQIAGRLDELPAAGIGGLGVVVLVAIGLAITDWFGITNIYPWVEEREPRRR